MSRAAILVEALRNRFWVLPAVGIVVAVGAGLALPSLDDSVRLPDAVSFAGGADTARSVLAMIATVAVSIAGISFSVIVVALVLASQQLSPRVLRSFQRHPLNQGALGLFLGTAAYSLVVLGSVGDGDDRAPELSVTVAMLLGALSLVMFVIFLHHLVRSLNASTVIRRIAALGHEAVEDPYPGGAGRAGSEDDERSVDERVRMSDRCQVRAPRAGYLASVDALAVLAAAADGDGFVEQRLAIGDFVVRGGVLAIAWCGDADGLHALARSVERAFVLNEERLIDGDVAFPIRQLADIALKGLSPGINDPTTAENAMNSLADNLARVARQEREPMLRVADDGVPRFRAVAPELDALVRLGFDQVRRDGAARPSFAVRLLELLADIREMGGPRAACCAEIAHQAETVRDHAIALADIQADADAVRAVYDHLHGTADRDEHERAEVAVARSPE